jgi:hypothetical protein
MNKLKAKRIHPAICKVLWEEWDPIGVNTNPKAFGEYDSYADGVYALLTRGASDGEIIHHLRHIQTVNMGLRPPSMEHLAAVVSALRAVDLE